ncbi:DUF6445 family protein [Arenimonas sp. MALMAid1274]|uniref:DUF6445 family protein n=1 Tax=Arenimonas sp. MALMAid1274 TaxID=3411630 RepID=UPI003BA07488
MAAVPLPPPSPPLRFNPRPRVERVSLGEGGSCLVVDDALREPEAWVEHAARHAAAFHEREHNGYPGPELHLPEAALAALDDFFALHARRGLGARRTLRRYARLSLATRAPAALSPWQWFCHTDRLEDGPGQVVGASVLYLFKDPSLGGTGFYRPRRPAAYIASLVKASATLSPDEFAARSGIARGYMTESNEWFERVAGVPAAFNRLILYPGHVFHSGDIVSPEKLSADPRLGRLTLNGFFVCRRSLA